MASGTNALFMWTLKPAKFLMEQEQWNRAVKGWARWSVLVGYVGQTCSCPVAGMVFLAVTVPGSKSAWFLSWGFLVGVLSSV